MDDAAAPRHSKRDAQPSAKATAALAAGSLDAAPSSFPMAPAVLAAPPPHRRSERHAKAATAATLDKSGDAPDADGTVARRDRRRTRLSASPIRGATSPSSTAPSSPVRSVSKTASANAVASADNSPALLSTPNRRRRPASRSSAIAMAVGDVSGAASDADKTQQSHRVLGKYSARECTLLCEVILDHVRRNALAGDVLERDRSPACIQWDKVAKRMLKTHRLTMTARECQILWKFLAYAEAPEQEDGVDGNPVGTNDKGDAELLPTSDEEDIERPIHEIHATRQGTRARKQKQRARLLSFTNGSTPASPYHAAAVASDKANIKGADVEGRANNVTKEGSTAEQSSAPKPGASSVPPAADDSTAPAFCTANRAAAASNSTSDSVALPSTVSPSKSTGGVRLYPTYELPSGSLDGWQRPFDVKKMLPLTFVAEKFLKKRAIPIPKPPGTTAVVSTKAEAKAEAAVPASSGNQTSATSTQAGASSSASANVVVTASMTAANAAVQAPSGMMSGSVTTTEAQVVKPAKKRPNGDASGPNSTTSGATAKPVKKKKTQSIKPVSTSSSNQPRAPFTPSTTPPPVPSPARTELDFFRLVHARLNDGSGSTNPTLEELAKFFQSAAPAIQEECKKLALIDVERFNRECVRRRIWEKAMGAVSQSNLPLLSPAVASTTSAASTVTAAGSNREATLPTVEQITGQQRDQVQMGSTPLREGSAPSSS